jgi:hypothetical protein
MKNNCDELVDILQKNNFEFQTLKIDVITSSPEIDRFLLYLQQEFQKYKDIRIELH